MRVSVKNLILFAALLFGAAPPVALAQQQGQQPAPQATFAPVMAQFGGQGSLLLPPMPALDISNYGTIEFWVAAKWNGDPGYDPAIMALTGAKGARFAVLISADKSSLGVYAGPNYATVPFDFSDNAQHYVALTVVADTITVMIDGEVQGTLDYGIANLPANRFSVGSMGKFSPFIGDIGQVRIWDEAIDPDVLVQFSYREIAATGPNAHPDIDALVGISSFGNPETGGFMFVGEPDDPVVATAPGGPIDDSSTGINDPEANIPGQ